MVLSHFISKLLRFSKTKAPKLCVCMCLFINILRSKTWGTLRILLISLKMPTVNPTPYKYKWYFLLKKTICKKKSTEKSQIGFTFLQISLVSGLIDFSWILTSVSSLGCEYNASCGLWNAPLTLMRKRAGKRPKSSWYGHESSSVFTGTLLTSVVLDHTLRTASLIKI